MANNNAPSAQPIFTFINVSDSQVRGDDETRRRVRRHAQADYRRRTSIQKPFAPIELDASSLVSGVGEDAPMDDNATLLGTQPTNVLAPGPSTVLDANRRDPFETFDIGNSRRAHFLWDHAYEGSCPKFRALHGMGFLDLARETIALPSLLSASAWHLVHTLRYERDQGEDAKFSLKTTQSLQQRLDSPLTSTSDEVVITVLAYAAYSNLTKDPALFDVHFNGLRQIFLCRVGDGFTDSSSAIRLALFWIETHGRFRSDSAPEFPLPIGLLAPRSQLLFPLPALDRDLGPEMSGNFEETATVTQTWAAIRRLNGILTKELSIRNDLWHDATFAVYHVSPVLYNLLTIPRASIHDDLSSQQTECFRLACILYMANLQSKFDPEPGIGMLYGTKLKMLLDREDMIHLWNSSKSMFLWILTVTACSKCFFVELRSYFFARLLSFLRASEANPIRAVLDIFNGDIWCKEAFQEEMSALMGQLESHP